MRLQEFLKAVEFIQCTMSNMMERILKKIRQCYNLKTVILAVLWLLLPQLANAQVVDSSFYSWTVYELQENELSPKQCYIVAHPIKSDSNQASRKMPYFMIARFQKQRDEEVSIYGGFEYKLNSKIFVAIDKYQFQFLAGKDIAWTSNKGEDIGVINTMLNSAVIKVRSDSSIGSFAIDEYSLKGITKAYSRMKEICK
jgi:hypothetical protein